MRKTIILAALMFSSIISYAQGQKWINNVKLSGFGIVQYQYNGMHNSKTSKSNSFNLRLARVSLDGRILDDWYWKAQLQVNGNTSTLGASPRVVDLFAEWQKYDYFRVKLGQFKNPFTFDNPIHPIDQGFMSVAQSVLKLASFSDRAGAHPSNGRDIGIQVQGDFLKNNAGRNLVHYQVGVFNGQGINTKDVDQQKNIIGGVWVMPVNGLRLGWFGWTGSYARKGTWTDNAGIAQSGVRKLQQRRYAFSAEYKANDWTLRSEYIHSTGYAFAKSLSNTDDAAAKDCNLSADGNKAQGVYALVIAPIIPNKLHAKARYDMYQSSDGAQKQRTQYDIGLDYEFTKNLALSGIYSYVHDRSQRALQANPNYSMLDVELSFRF
ncbi:porin [Prevotella sp.]|jgi:phosphate-selective porin O and P family protein|uniref:porin n=1 Tax=Prevotella sp. TaxID=59823 RepID=UPI001CB5F499|nr:porin [Prevotella sp.]MBF1628910.1 porin [Prevotella sp.]